MNRQQVIVPPFHLEEASAPRTEADDPGFAVYVHWPFCLSKCPYCDFNSHVRAGGIDETRFLRAYLAELAHMRTLTGPREVRSVFFGGGTPSLMAPGTVATILDAIALNWPFAPGAEVTLEANPTSVEAENFAGYRIAGVNRVSLGVQALDAADLRSLGRLHSVEEALDAVALAQANFDRVSFDLIYARPGQTVAAWREELARALGVGVGHLSLYQLTIEPQTPFAALHASGKLVIPDEDLARALYEETQEMTQAAGLPAYEVSNHARPGEECRHNLIYWRMGEWAGVGPGAHGRLVVDGERRATVTERAPEAWVARVEADGHGLDTCESVSPADQADEYLLMGLRLAEGVDLDRHGRLGGTLDRARIDALAAAGLVERHGRRLRVTAEGRLVLNSLIAELTA